MIDEYTLPEDVDPARWPFDEARARARAAAVAFPDPPLRHTRHFLRDQDPTPIGFGRTRRRTRVIHSGSTGNPQPAATGCPQAESCRVGAA